MNNKFIEQKENLNAMYVDLTDQEARYLNLLD